MLPVCGSIKARGGMHEVLWLAEKRAVEAGIRLPNTASDGVGGQRDPDDSFDYVRFHNDPTVRRAMQTVSVAVASTGNLALSVGMCAAALGMRASAFVSSEAAEWKVEKLQSAGVTVVRVLGDYCDALEAARHYCEETAAHFVDDEHSALLFAGYAVAIRRLQKQLVACGIDVNKRDLVVYIPCGVGGAPSGLTFELKRRFPRYSERACDRFGNCSDRG
ncbi:MAG: hypothetical protein MHM6MM_002331 [Cercozoa sp. M6MM]